MSGYDTHLIVHLHDGDHAAALESAESAQRLLESAGYLVTRKPTLPYVPVPWSASPFGGVETDYDEP